MPPIQVKMHQCLSCCSQNITHLKSVMCLNGFPSDSSNPIDFLKLLEYDNYTYFRLLYVFRKKISGNFSIMHRKLRVGPIRIEVMGMQKV